MKYLFYFFLSLIIIGCSSLPEGTEKVTAKEQIAADLANQGKSAFEDLEYERAIEFYYEALLAYGGIDSQEGFINCLLSLSNIEMNINNKEKSWLYLENAELYALEYNQSNIIQRVYNQKANWYIYQGLLEEANNILIERTVLSLDELSPDLATKYRLLGIINKTLDQSTEAERYLIEALKIDTENDSRKMMALDSYLLGSIYSLKGKYNLAIEYLNNALEHDKYIEYTGGIAADLTALAKVYSKNGDNDMAVALYRRAYWCWKKLGVEEKCAQILNECISLGEYTLNELEN